MRHDYYHSIIKEIIQPYKTNKTMNNAENNTGKIVGALLLGTAVGAALGLLFAPAKGSETRKKILDGAKGLADDVKDNLKDSVSNIWNKVKEGEEMAKSKYDDLRSNGRKGEEINNPDKVTM
jgi:gas vesicle protein